MDEAPAAAPAKIPHPLSGCGRTIAARLALAAVSAAVGASQAAAEPFARNSFWNKPLAARAPLDPHSAAYVADLRHQLTIGHPWINTHSWSVPVYTVGVGQRPVRVRLDTH